MEKVVDASYFIMERAKYENLNFKLVILSFVILFTVALVNCWKSTKKSEKRVKSVWCITRILILIDCIVLIVTIFNYIKIQEIRNQQKEYKQQQIEERRGKSKQSCNDWYEVDLS